MNRLMKTISLVLTLCLLLSALPLGDASAEEAIDPNLTCTITLGNWPADTAPEAAGQEGHGYSDTCCRVCGRIRAEDPGVREESCIQRHYRYRGVYSSSAPGLCSLLAPPLPLRFGEQPCIFVYELLCNA